MSCPEPRPKTGYVHARTFFQYNRWSAHDHVGELLARGVTQISMVQQGADWVVSWIENTPPDVIKEAEGTPA